MRIVQRGILAAACAFGVLASGCSGVPVDLGSRATRAIPTGPSREIEGTACGFQLLLFIPIRINSRLERAYKELEDQANGDYVTDVQVRETWSYGLVGTGYCTDLKAKAIARS